MDAQFGEVVSETKRDDTLTPGALVRHPRFGSGVVEFDKGATTIVRFDRGLEECERGTLDVRQSLEQAIAQRRWSGALDVVTKAQAAAIVSLNDAWGVFSRSRISLLPHQLWVCHRVLRQWPARFLIADDVGLGKTIEAGLILWPLLSKQLVRRLLILCPASLVEQWQFRLRDMFDIRLHRYLLELDTDRGDFWGGHTQVVASLQTLRADNQERQERLFEAEPWDLLIVDEAHHLNAEERVLATLGYRLVDRLISEGKAESCLFFTGTPHRGKPYGFWALLRLLRPDLFDPSQPDEEQFPRLHEVLIRNNKQTVTDMRGAKLFKPVNQFPETYRYSPAEAHFYRLLTEFIATGRAYASSLSAQNQRVVMLVLISMQKLASSSVAAIRRAIQGRLARLRAEQAGISRTRSRRRVTSPVDSGIDASLLDVQQELDERLPMELDPTILLMRDEIGHLEQLLAAADEVEKETKIERVMEVIGERFPDESVLLFTEYKATQALVMSELRVRFGDDCVTFINGDEALDAVRSRNGEFERLRIGRTRAADHFNGGTARFLVSTEAGGEGIDLQERCHAIVHVDLPWNPMRLHQRVGRLNRYGQRYAVDVVTVRNPDTVEARIWQKLNEKLEHITRALGSVMEEPEDLLQLVLGMAAPNLFDEVFSEAGTVERERLSEWFDEKTHTFGGRSAIETVRALVGNAARFDYQGIDEIPKADLPDLQSFFENALRLNRRRPVRKDGRLSFRTPDAWLIDRGVRRQYADLVFSRRSRERARSEQIVGVGHRAFDQAVKQALESAGTLAAISSLEKPLVLCQIYDEVTERVAAVQRMAVGVSVDFEGNKSRLLVDGELVRVLNALVPRDAVAPDVSSGMLEECRRRAVSALEGSLAQLRLPFTAPRVRAVCVLWPAELTAVLHH